VNLGWRWRILAVIQPQILRVETTQLRPSTIGGELPIDLAIDRVSRGLPCIHFAPKEDRVVNSPIQTLSDFPVGVQRPEFLGSDG
jgi:hypothetical protein